jgi:regulator of protease activity HflC (stomatin/prohibitin superfamily)
MKPIYIIAPIGALIFIVIFSLSTAIVPPGQVGVGSFLGKVIDAPYEEGFHLKSPLTSITLFDARQKTLKESMSVPSRDQLLTTFDISIQYRLIKEKAPHMLKETGAPQQVVDVHMTPLLRSQLRELGKTVETAEKFYDNEIQHRLQTQLLDAMHPLQSKGILIEKLLIRDITLPKIITDAVLRKKEAAQSAEKAKEELKRFKVDQERKEAQAEAEKRAELIQANKKKEVLLIQANAELEAAKIDAESMLVRARAEAEAKKVVIDTLTLEGFVKLESMQALKDFQNGNHVIIMDPKSTNPLPFLNLRNTQP